VLGVVHDELAVLFQAPHGVGHHLQVFLRRGLKHFAHVQQPGLPVDGDDGCSGGDQQLDLFVVFRRDSLAPGGAEGREPRTLERETLGPLEELDVFGIGTRPSPLDVMDAKGVEPLGDSQFVGYRERNALALAAVTQRRIVDLDR